MRYASSLSVLVDSYQAGVAIAEGVQAINPEVLLVFVSIHHIRHMADLLCGIRDVLGPMVRICGGSGDGVYGTHRMANHGVTALAMHGEGKVRWAMSLQKGVQADSAAAAEKAGHEAQRLLGEPACMGFVMADGARADGSRIAAGLRRTLAAPFFGGLAGDDRSINRTMVFADDTVAEDAVMVLLAAGHLPFRQAAASGWTPLGMVGTVTRCNGNIVEQIDNLSARDFVIRETGRALASNDEGVVPLAEYLNGDTGPYLLRTIATTKHSDGSLRLFGQIRQGASVRICHASQAQMLHAVDEALEKINTQTFTPAAALVVSCAGRKWLLAESGAEEVRRVKELLGPIPMAGFPSFGEIAPADGHSDSPPLFHNETFVTVIFGN